MKLIILSTLITFVTVVDVSAQNILFQAEDTFSEITSRKLYSILVPPNRLVTISATSDSFDTYLVVEAPDGFEYDDDDSGANTNSLLRISTGQGGELRIVVESLFEDPGEYSLTVTDEGVSSLQRTITNETIAIASGEDNIRKNIERFGRKQVTTLRNISRHIERMKVGSQAITTSLSSIQLGRIMQEPSSPFISVEFNDRFEKIDKFTNFIAPAGAGIGSVISLAANSSDTQTTENILIGALSGLAVKAVIGLFTKRDKNIETAVEKGIQDFYETQRLLSFNRIVFNDLRQFGVLVDSARVEDIELTDDLIRFADAYKLSQRSDEDLRIADMSIFVDSTLHYIARFEQRLDKASGVYDRARSIFQGYKDQGDLNLARNIFSPDSTYSHELESVSQVIVMSVKSFEEAYDKARKDWYKLEDLVTVPADLMDEIETYRQYQTLKQVFLAQEEN